MTQFADLSDLGLRFVINAVAMAILLFGMYYHRHGDRTLVTTAAMFNVFAFAVLGKLTSVEFGFAAGFGLFAILALFNLRSVQIGRVEIAYFFGAVAIAVICSIVGSGTGNMIAVSSLVLLSVYVIDHPALMRGTHVVTVKLNEIKPQFLTSPELMRNHIGQKLGVQVVSFEIVSLDLVKDLAVIDLTYKDAVQRQSSWLIEEPRSARSEA